MKRILFLLLLLPVVTSAQFTTVKQGLANGTQRTEFLGGAKFDRFFGLPLLDSVPSSWYDLGYAPDFWRRRTDSVLMQADLKNKTSAAINVTGAITPEMFGAKGDGITNDFNAVKTALSKNANVVLLSTYYIGDSTLNIKGSNFTIDGAGKGRIKGTKDILLQNSDSLINVTFRGVTFEGTGSGGDFFGLFTSFDKTIKGLRFLNCGFTAPMSVSNGVKIINQGSAVCRNILFDGCSFYDLGQMGIEFQNHNYDSIYRYQDVIITNNSFNNLGTASTFGMAISFSGRGQYLNFSNNTIYKAKNIGIELAIGQKDVVISGNVIDSCKTGCAPFSFSNGTNTWDHLNVTITDNISFSESRVNLYRLNNSVIANNHFFFTGTSGYVQMTNGFNTLFANNTIRSDASFGVFCNFSSGKVFQYNIFQGNNITCTAAGSTCIQIDGVSSTNNTIFGNVLKKSTGGSYYAFTNSATGSAKFNYPDGVAEAITGTNWRIDDATGKYFGAGISNYTNAASGEILTQTTGLLARITDAASANTTFTVRTAGSGRLQDWQNTSNTRVASMLVDGGLRGTGLYNFTQDINSSVEPTANGTVIKRTINTGTFPVLVSDQAGTASGPLYVGRKQGVDVFTVGVGGDVLSTQYKLPILNTAPANATATGTLGEIRITATFIYVCTATNTWVRAALATW